jgi:hypothetical protein
LGAYCWGCTRLTRRGVYCWRCAKTIPDYRPVVYGSYRVCRLRNNGTVVTVMRATAYPFIERWLDKRKRTVKRGRIWVEQTMMTARRSV